MRVGVRIMPRNEVLDSQGRAVEKTLDHHGISVSSCRVGKYVVLDFPVESEQEALSKAHEVAEFVLYNPLVESCEMEVLESQ